MAVLQALRVRLIDDGPPLTRDCPTTTENTTSEPHDSGRRPPRCFFRRPGRVHLVFQGLWVHVQDRLEGFLKCPWEGESLLVVGVGHGAPGLIPGLPAGFLGGGARNLARRR